MLAFGLYLFSMPVKAQDTTYYNLKNKPVKSIKNAEYFTVVNRDTTTENRITERKYSKEGKLVSEKEQMESPNEKDNKLTTKNDGYHRVWFDNGILKSEIKYKAGKKDSLLLTYWDNGLQKRRDIYENGKFVSGECFDKEGKIIDYFPYEQMPQFPGGDQELFKFLSQNVKYPVSAQKSGIQGRVITQFVVDAEGKITDQNVIRSINRELDQEALRVIRAMPVWIPGIQDGEKVRVKYTLPVNFRLK